MAPPHILIVDNNLDKLDLIKSACQSAGYEVIGLSDVEKGLDTATILQPDLIIAVDTAPGMNGYELAAQIRSNPRTKFIPVILQTTARYSPDRRRGSQNYIADPADLDLLLARVRTLMEFKSYLDACEQAAFTDHLSGLANRRRFERQLEIEVTRTLRETNSPFSLLVIDIDHFKRVNDNYGHQAGDQVIQQIGKQLGGIARPTDLAARLGGEEFGVILAETPLESAIEIAERLRCAIKRDEISGVGQITASIGVAEFGSFARTAKDLVLVADNALYEAKRKGRDRVERAQPPLTGAISYPLE